jgi:hypothetical protein
VSSGGKEDDVPSNRSLAVAKKMLVNATNGERRRKRMAKGSFTNAVRFG